VLVRYVRSEQPCAGIKSQNWLSVADDDASALMFFSPWAAVDVEGGRSLFSEEPSEFKYDGLEQMEHEQHDCGDENADLQAENVVKTKFSVATLLMKHVEVDWRRRQLVDVNGVVSLISHLRSNE
jgi:cytochrome b